MAFATRALSPFLSAAIERLTPPTLRAPTHTPPSGSPGSLPRGWRLPPLDPSPPHRARPLRGQRRRVRRATLDIDSPGAGRFSVPSAVGRPTSHHGAAY